MAKKKKADKFCGHCLSDLSVTYKPTKNGHVALKVMCNRCGVRYERGDK